MGIERDHIILEDPAVGARRRISRYAFLNVWFDFKRVLPRSKDDLILRRLIVVAPDEKWLRRDRRPRRSGSTPPA
jgi:hypothetical protein